MFGEAMRQELGEGIEGELVELWRHKLGDQL
jgi:hypothetical protein